MTSFLDTLRTDALATVRSLVEASDEMAIATVINSLPSDLVPVAILEVMKRKRIMNVIQESLELRASKDGLKSWTDPQTKTLYDFKVGQKRVVSSARQLKNALLDALHLVWGRAMVDADGVIDETLPHLQALRASFRENEDTVMLTELDIFLALDPVYAEAADRFVTWTPAAKAPHLTENRHPRPPK